MRKANLLLVNHPSLQHCTNITGSGLRGIEKRCPILRLLDLKFVPVDISMRENLSKFIACVKDFV